MLLDLLYFIPVEEKRIEVRYKSEIIFFFSEIENETGYHISLHI